MSRPIIKPGPETYSARSFGVAAILQRRKWCDEDWKKCSLLITRLSVQLAPAFLRDYRRVGDVKRNRRKVPKNSRAPPRAPHPATARAQINSARHLNGPEMRRFVRKVIGSRQRKTFCDGKKKACAPISPSKKKRMCLLHALYFRGDRIAWPSALSLGAAATWRGVNNWL